MILNGLFGELRFGEIEVEADAAMLGWYHFDGQSGLSEEPLERAVQAHPVLAADLTVQALVLAGELLRLVQVDAPCGDLVLQQVVQLVAEYEDGYVEIVVAVLRVLLVLFQLDYEFA